MSAPASGGRATGPQARPSQRRRPSPGSARYRLSPSVAAAPTPSAVGEGGGSGSQRPPLRPPPAAPPRTEDATGPAARTAPPRLPVRLEESGAPAVPAPPPPAAVARRGVAFEPFRNGTPLPPFGGADRPVADPHRRAL